MSGYIGATSVSFDVTEANIKGDLKSTDDSPEVVLTNTTEEDTDGGRESKITFKGEQSGGELSTLAQIQASHDGTADDEKGDLIFSTNDGSDGNTPTERMRVDSAGNVGIGVSDPDTALHIAGGANPTLQLTAYEGTQNCDIQILPIRAELTGSESIMAFKTNDGTSLNEVMRIDEDGNVGIGTTSPSVPFHLDIGTDNNALYIESSDQFANIGLVDGSGSGKIIMDSGELAFTTGGNATTSFTGSAEAMRINSSGKVGIGTSSPSEILHVATSGGASVINLQRTNSNTSGSVGTVSFTALDNHAVAAMAAIGDGNDEGAHLTFRTTSSASGTNWFSSTTERVRIESGGNFAVGQTSGIGGVNSSTNGAVLGAQGYGMFQRAGSTVGYFNRNNNDGLLINFYQAGAQEGNISVSGSSVSYNGGHLSRWSQLSDNTKDTSIVKGTVMTNLDQMAVWTHAAKEVGDDILDVAGNVIGQETEAQAAWTEDNDQLNCMAVSSVEGDANVAGVFVNWDDDDVDFTNDMNVAMTGDFVIRIAQGTTVARGDLLMSAGDGTAKPQGDDIVRSKTIAKVTSTHVSHTYDDGSYLVPCVLMAC